MRPLAYTLSYIFPVMTVVSMLIGGWSLVAVPLLTFGLVPFVELFFHGTAAASLCLGGENCRR